VALDLSSLADGTITTTVFLTDTLGNTNTPVSATLIKDTVAPAAPTVVINPADDTGAFSSDWVTSVTAPRLSAVGEAGAVQTVYVNGTVYTGQTLADGSYTVGAALRDAAGNTSPMAFAAGKLVIDTTAPTGSFVIAGTTLVNGQPATNSPNLGLQLSFSDALSGLSWVALSSDGGQTYAVSEAYAAYEAVSLGADDLYFVTVRVTDLAGNSGVFTQSIRLDTSGPAVADSLSGSGTNGVYDVGQILAFTYSCSDVDGCRATASLDNTQALVSGASINLDTLVAGTHQIVVTAVDSLGNQTSTTVTFQVHATAGGLIKAMSDGVASGQITCNTNAMVTKLQAAQAAYARGDNVTAKGLLYTYLNQVSSQAGKGINGSLASLLTSWTQDLISRT